MRIRGSFTQASADFGHGLDSNDSLKGEVGDVAVILGEAWVACVGGASGNS